MHGEIIISRQHGHGYIYNVLTSVNNAPFRCREICIVRFIRHFNNLSPLQWIRQVP
jgi:hypothetical protein